MTARALWIRAAAEAALLLLGLVAWGAGFERVFWGAGMGAVLAAARLSPYRLHSSPRARARANDLTLGLIALGGLWFYLQRQALQTNVTLHVLSLCPVFLFPRMLFSCLQDVAVSRTGGSRDGVAVARAWIGREYGFARTHLDAPRGIDLASCYFFLSLLLAGMSLPWRAGAPAMIAGGCAYCLLWGWRRGAGSRFVVWTALACSLSAGGSVLGAAAIGAAQQAAEGYFSNLWGSRRGDSRASANVADTSIGRRGRLDLGMKLLMRVETPSSLDPIYLRDGAFTYTPNGTTWFARAPSRIPGDRQIFPSDGSSFTLATPQTLRAAGVDLAKQSGQIKISTTLPRERAALALPAGTMEIFGLPLSKLEVNEMNVPTTLGAAGFVKFGVSLAKGADFQPPPRDSDLQVPLSLQVDIDAFAREAGAENLAPPLAAAAIVSHFQRNWEYSLDLESIDGSSRGISRFLRGDRRGHCEYFATVATLALRRLGVPARYQTGFKTTEFDAREKLYWIRARDAHAWSSFWDGSAWRRFDPTPGGLFPDSGLADQGSDWMARLQYLFEEFDAASLAEQVDPRVSIGLGLALALLLGRSVRLRRAPASGEGMDRRANELCDLIERRAGLVRAEREALFDFWRRAAPALADPASLLALADAREAALFKPTRDRVAELARCERMARELRRRVRPKRQT